MLRGVVGLSNLSLSNGANNQRRFGVADGEAAGSAVGAGVAVATGVGVTVGTGVGVGASVGSGVAVGVGVGTGVAVATGVGVTVGKGVAVAEGVGVGAIDGLADGTAVAAGVLKYSYAPMLGGESRDRPRASTMMPVPANPVPIAGLPWASVKS